jgi:nucleoside-diphosphate-sugar epimerase
MKRSVVLLTGANGFLGRHVAEELIARGHNIRTVVRDKSNVAALRTHLGDRSARVDSWTIGTLSDASTCDRAVAGCDAVVHVAAGLTGSPSSLFLDTVVATRNLVEAALSHRIRKFVLVSSLGVYGTWRLGREAVLDESCALDPTPHLRDPYSFSKIEQERVCWSAYTNRRLPLAVIRPGVIYGPGRGYMSARIGLPIGGRLFLQLGGTNRLPYTHVRNCADAIALALANERSVGEAINIVDDELPSGRQLLALHRSTQSAPPRVVRLHSRAVPLLARAYEFFLERSDGMLPPALTRYRADAQWKPLRYPNEKAKNLLGWQPRVGLGAGLASC